MIWMLERARGWTWPWKTFPALSLGSSNSIVSVGRWLRSLQDGAALRSSQLPRLKQFHIHQLNKKQKRFYRKCPSFVFGLQYLKTYPLAARAALFETVNKTNFSHTLEGFTGRKSPVSDITLFPQLSFNCLSLQRSEMFSFSALLLPIPETRMICKIWICKSLQAPAFPRRTCGS